MVRCGKEEKMEIELKHDIQKNYLVVHGGEECQYMVHMLEGTSVKGFLDLEVRVIDNQNHFYYDITGMESIEQKTQREKWNLAQLKQMVAEIMQTIGRAKEYLLEGSHFVLQPSYIYRHMENGTIALCYTWEHTEEINQQLTELFAYLLNAVDYQDKKAVEFVYLLYDMSREENCTLQRLWTAFEIQEEPVQVEQEEIILQEKLEKRNEKSKNTNLLSLGKKYNMEGEKQKQLENPTASKISAKQIVEVLVLQLLCVLLLYGLHMANVFTVYGELSYTNVMIAVLVIGVVDAYLLGRILESKQEPLEAMEKGKEANFKRESSKSSIKDCCKGGNKEEHSIRKCREKNISKDKKECKKEDTSVRTSLGQFNRSTFILERENPDQNKIPLVENQSAMESVQRRFMQQDEKLYWDKTANETELEEKLGEATVVVDYDKTVCKELPSFKKKSKVCKLIPRVENLEEIQMLEFPFYIGRFQEHTNQLKENIGVSRMHCKIEEQYGKYYVYDLRSTNGTYVNERKIEQDCSVEVRSGDKIAIADSVYEFLVSAN